MRVSGVNIPKQKRILISLQYVYGIGLTRATQILGVAGIDESIRTKDLSRDQEDKIRQIIEKNYKIEGDLKRERMMNVKRLKDISCWRGLRYFKGLPVRGQRTRTNSRTVRGNVRKTVGSGRKPAPTPT